MNGIEYGWVWLGFFLFLVAALSADTFLLKQKHARPHESMRAAICWTSIWVTCALIFNALLWCYVYFKTDTALANKKALEFFTGYLIEESLSIDNLFAFYLIFRHFRIPVMYQQRVFSYGIWSAIVLRLIFILLGVWVVTRFHWALYIMGVFLVLTGIKIAVSKEKNHDLSDSLVFKLLNRILRVTHELRTNHFFIRRNGLLYATPLFLALIFVELSDVIFALDSIPAIFAITTDPFIIWTSNIFAILGLRSLYFLLSGMADRFHLLKYGIALILIFIGTKWSSNLLVISVGVSLSVIASILLVFSWLSTTAR